MRSALLVLVVANLLQPLPAAAAGTLDLAAAANLALKRAPTFAAAVAARDASLEDRKIGLAGLLPFIKGTGEFSHYEQKYSYTRPKSFLASDVVFNRFDIGVTLVQPLFRLDRWATFTQGRLASQLGELKLRLAQQTLLLQVAGEYTDVLAAQEDVRAAVALEKAVERLRQQAKTAFEVGTVTVTDALEAESRLDLVRAQRIQSENALASARARLASLIGIEDVRVQPFSATTRLPSIIPEKPGRWREDAVHAALAVRVAEKKLAVAKQEVRRAMGIALPSVDFVAGLDRTKETSNLFDTGSTVKTEQVGVQVEVPFYAGGGTRAQLRKARKLQVKADYELKEARRRAGLTAYNAFLSVRATAARVRAFERGLISARKARQAAAIGYRVGVRTIVELLDAEEREAEAHSNLSHARAAYLMARLQLAAAVGRLNMETVKKIAALMLAPAAR